MAYAYIIRYSKTNLAKGIKCVCSSQIVAEKYKKQIEQLGGDPIVEKWEIWKR
jgi:hypothetical protein